MENISADQFPVLQKFKFPQYSENCEQKLFFFQNFFEISSQKLGKYIWKFQPYQFY